MNIQDILPYFNKCQSPDNGTLSVYWLKADHQLIINGTLYNQLVELPNGYYELPHGDDSTLIDSNQPIKNCVVIKVTKQVLIASN